LETASVIERVLRAEGKISTMTKQFAVLVGKGCWLFQLKCAQIFLDQKGGEFKAGDKFNHTLYSTYPNTISHYLNTISHLLDFKDAHHAFWGSKISTYFQCWCKPNQKALKKDYVESQMAWSGTHDNFNSPGWTDIYDLSAKLKVALNMPDYK
jgi:hypothetical protein